MLHFSAHTRNMVLKLTVSTKFATQSQTLPPLFTSFFDESSTGPRRLRLANTSRRWSDVRAVYATTWSLKEYDGKIAKKNKKGLVRPATEDHAEEAIEALKAGKVIAVPTDTLYGFACDACSTEAVNRIYEIKGRKSTKPLAICVGDVEDIQWFATTSHLPHGLLDTLLPGPVTVVLTRGESSLLEKSLNPGHHSIGVRVPDSDFIRVISRGSKSALALTSANLSGKPSSVRIDDFKTLWPQCAYVYNGGVLPSGRAGSTVVDLTKSGHYEILRPGSAMEETVEILDRYGLVLGSSTI